MKSHIGYLLYGFLSLIESLGNLVLYLTFLYKITGVLDISLPSYYWYNNKFLKRDFIKKAKNGQIK